MVKRAILERGQDALSLAQQVSQLAPFSRFCATELSALLQQPDDGPKMQCALRAVTQLMVNSLAAVQQKLRQLGVHMTAARLEQVTLAKLVNVDACDLEASDSYLSAVTAAQDKIRCRIDTCNVWNSKIFIF